eukprot:473134-Prymnesium_polylepis.1
MPPVPSGHSRMCRHCPPDPSPVAPLAIATLLSVLPFRITALAIPDPTPLLPICHHCPSPRARAR